MDLARLKRYKDKINFAHEYNGLDDYKAYQSLIKLLPELNSFLIMAEQWLNIKLSSK